jgi:hypothetical protein
LKYILILISFLVLQPGSAQPYIYGRITSDSGIYLGRVKISNSAETRVYFSDSAGNYRVPYIIGKRNNLSFEREGFNTFFTTVPKIFEDEVFSLDIEMVPNVVEVGKGTVVAKKEAERGTIVVLKPMDTRPSLSMDFNDIVKSLPGVSSNNELSSQYNVRGGSYDENLVYVNDIEVYRPQLVRSGQQEGLSFVNSDMVNNLIFSAGGFEARYGDKLSSVLDVSYRKPKENGAGIQIGLLGASFYVEGIMKASQRVGYRDSTRFTYLMGARYRGNKNLLNSLDAQGLYKSRFGDFQSLLTYHFNRFSRVEFLGNYAQNRFRFEPEFQETTFGTLQSALKLSIGMEGQEIVDYRSGMGALSFIHNKLLKELKFIVSAYASNESEHYDIQGAYEISEVDNNLGSSNFGNTKSLLGNGYFVNHARNDLYFQVMSFAHQGTLKLKGIRNKRSEGIENLRHPGKLIWGAKYQVEIIEDKFKEWKFNDSGGYNINPFSKSDKLLEVTEYIRSRTNIRNQRISGFGQYQQGFGRVNQWSLVSGIRYLYSSLNDQSLLSPRVQLYFEPNKAHNIKYRKDSSQLRKNILLRGAFGYYYQAPFYREMRNFDGIVNTSLKAQRSIHYVSGIEFDFVRLKRPFRFTAEVYYKNMDYLVPYVLDNVRIRYYASNSSRGYATGFDTRVNGEFIKGIESWFTLSVLKTDEKITYVEDSVVVESKFLRRPTDRRVSASIMFQDELKTNPDYRMHLMLNFGSGMPYYLGGSARYKEGNTIPAYKRVDIGFSKVIIGGKKTKIESKNIETLWLGIDVYNLLQINNVISYLWVKDFSNNTYGVPNYLTGRRVNVRVVAKF